MTSCKQPNSFDVLAVMDNVACGAPAGHDFRMARAAVAELIEALVEQREADADRRPDGLRNMAMDLRSMRAEERVEAALARVQGGAE